MLPKNKVVLDGNTCLILSCNPIIPLNIRIMHSMATYTQPLGTQLKIRQRRLGTQQKSYLPATSNQDTFWQQVF